MREYEKRIHRAKPGQIIPMVREIDITCPVDFFARLRLRAEKALLSARISGLPDRRRRRRIDLWHGQSGAVSDRSG